MNSIYPNLTSDPTYLKMKEALGKNIPKEVFTPPSEKPSKEYTKGSLVNIYA